MSEAASAGKQIVSVNYNYNALTGALEMRIAARLYTKSVRAHLMLGAPTPARLQLTDAPGQWASDYKALENQV
jgi:hypothetical protein